MPSPTSEQLTRVVIGLWQILDVLAIGGSLIHWARRGGQFPRWVHRLALLLGAAGVLMAVVLAGIGDPDRGVMVACVLVPPAAAYVGFLWLGGPLLGPDA